MLNEFLAIFVGALYQFAPDSQYVDVLCIGVLWIVLATVSLTFLTVLKNVLTIIWKVGRK